MSNNCYYFCSNLQTKKERKKKKKARVAARWAILIKLNFLYIAPVMKPTFHFSVVVDKNVQAQVAQWQDLGRRSDADRFW